MVATISAPASQRNFLASMKDDALIFINGFSITFRLTVQCSFVEVTSSWLHNGHLLALAMAAVASIMKIRHLVKVGLFFKIAGRILACSTAGSIMRFINARH